MIDRPVAVDIARARGPCSERLQPTCCLKKASVRSRAVRGRAGIVRSAVIAVEAVTRVVGVHRMLRMARAPVADDGHRDHRVAFAEVAEHRAARNLVQHVADAAAVVDDGGGESVEPACGQPGEITAPAIADDTDPTGGADVIARRRDVQQRGIGARAGLEIAPLGDVLLGCSPVPRPVAGDRRARVRWRHSRRPRSRRTRRGCARSPRRSPG